MPTEFFLFCEAPRDPPFVRFFPGPKRAEASWPERKNVRFLSHKVQV